MHIVRSYYISKVRKKSFFAERSGWGLRTTNLRKFSTPSLTEHMNIQNDLFLYTYYHLILIFEI